MKPEQDEPTLLTIAAPKGSSPAYPWIGLLVGAGVGVLLGYPMVLVINHFHDHFICGLPLTLSQAILRGLTPQMWPFMLLYAISGGVGGGDRGVCLPAHPGKPAAYRQSAPRI